MTLTLAPIAVPNFSGASTPVTSYNDGTNNTPAHLLLDNTGALVGPATSANQATANTSLATIATNTANIPAKGSATSANSTPVVIASDQGALPLPTGASTSALQTAGNATLGSILTATQAATPAGANLIGYANAKDPAAATGTITAADAATTTASNSVTQSITTGTPTANSSLSATLSAHSGVTLQLSGTFSGTVAFERSVDGGTTFVPFSLEEVAVGATVTSLTISDNRAYVLRGNAGAMTTVRVRCTAYTSGTLAVLVQPGFGTGMVVANQGTPNAANPWTQNLTQVAGAAISQGHGTAATAIRVELPTDGTGVVGIAAGSAIIGKLGIDQTTPGTTNLVQLPTSQITTLTPPTTVNVTQATGTNLHAVVDSGTITAVTAITNALPAGSNVIGGVTIADGSNVSFGAKADAAITTPASTGSLMAFTKGLLTQVNSLVTGTILAASSAVIGKVGIDQTTPGTTNLVQLPAPLVVTGSTTTRPANTTAYAYGQLLANSTTAGSVTYPTISPARANNQGFTLLRCRLQKSGTTTTNALFRVHFFNALPSVTNGDGGAFLSTTAGWIGSFDVTCNQAFSDSAMGIGYPSIGPAVLGTPVSGAQTLYYLIEVRAAYTPASAEVFTPYLEVQ